MMPGIAMEARIASSTGPRCSQTDLPVIGSVATEVNGIGNCSMVTSPRISRTASRTFSARSTPADVNDGSSRRRMARCVSELAQAVCIGRACRPPPGRRPGAHRGSSDTYDLVTAFAEPR